MEQDNYLWLEEVESQLALDWVREQNQRSQAELEQIPVFKPFQDAILSSLENDQKIPYGTRRNSDYFNFWQDKDHVKGIWRKTAFADFVSGTPRWQTLLDLDALNKQEQANWVIGAIDVLAPEHNKALIKLSPGGSDAGIVREFDLVSKTFLSDGFHLPEAKNMVTWVNEQQIIVATDFGPNSLTDSGYPAQVKLWHRQTSLNDSKLLLTIPTSEMGLFTFRLEQDDQSYTGVSRCIDFFHHRTYILVSQQLIELPLPEQHDIQGLFNDHLLVSLKADWLGFKQADLIALPMASLLCQQPEPTLVYRPSSKAAIQRVTPAKNVLYVELLENVSSRLLCLDKNWQVSDLTPQANLSLSVIDASEEDDSVLVKAEGFLLPESLFLLAPNQPPQMLRQLAPQFNASDLQVEQHWVNSKDGTQVPYFLIAKKDLELNGTTPTILYGYGGFEIALKPSYLAHAGKTWLAQGGAYAIANIRGGGEFGPAWHQAALTHQRQRAYDDFFAVAEDLINRKVTQPKHLGAMGGSNGGLLMGVCLTQRPELFNAINILVPLLDMKRFHLLLAGASWMAEYGNPDIAEDWAVIKTYSPYQNLVTNRHYPKVLLRTSTKDDRVHPAHARKLAAKMAELGHPFFYYENIEGGHAGAADLKQSAYTKAMDFAYFWHRLGHE
ncbi:prolyl oligopeptidase family serine peptidase [Motilimonas cestriensis]|uniref:Prolyl oligopeptidase family serine peptidase n=1 Tax=Motilimonas cestriensis TaxID=2742685 RepID=A0ABS8W7Z6_9GAMM|nr:prolyl oligopeptidase family serine peptidase [Motilimonas cestriensis]MCE2593510.1 prolyl oligopeptidase family serine peptidase [Motilimonas cestriensis]